MFPRPVVRLSVSLSVLFLFVVLLQLSVVVAPWEQDAVREAPLGDRGASGSSLPGFWKRPFAGTE